VAPLATLGKPLIEATAGRQRQINALRCAPALARALLSHTERHHVAKRTGGLMTVTSRPYGRFGHCLDSGRRRPIDRLLDYLGSRSLETWLFFGVGLALGWLI
jgi:hypothetical protein